VTGESDAVNRVGGGGKQRRHERWAFEMGGRIFAICMSLKLAVDDNKEGLTELSFTCFISLCVVYFAQMQQTAQRDTARKKITRM